jgi:hypothetical protein
MMGVLPCFRCQGEDRQTQLRKPPEFATQSQSNRVKEEREINAKDIIQPWTTGSKINPEFAQAYPDKVTNYFTEEQLKKL